jgi:hypothetical protein
MLEPPICILYLNTMIDVGLVNTTSLGIVERCRLSEETKREA